MKKWSIILLTLLLAFGFSSAAMANGDGGAVRDTDKSVTYSKGVTTIVITEKDVSYDKKVDVKKSSKHFKDKKSKKATSTKVETDKKREMHPERNLYRIVKTATTYRIVKTTSWDQITRVDKVKETTTPVKITKTTVTTIKQKGKPGKNGKILSKDKETSIDKKFGKKEMKVDTKKHVYKKNVKQDVKKKVINVKKTKSDWMRLKQK